MWLAHICLDRADDDGLKYGSGFRDAYLPFLWKTVRDGPTALPSLSR